jgi:exopolysaccharide biosynthesis protein
MCQKIHSIYFVSGFFIVFLIFMVLNCNATALNRNIEPSIKINSIKNKLGNYRHIQLVNKNIELDAVILSEGYHAKIYQQKAMNQSAAQSIREVAQENNASVAINGGFYTSNFQPAGLFIDNGKILEKVSGDPLLTSCVQVNKRGILFLEKKIDRCLHAMYAMQTGPLLIERGNISPNLKVLQSNLINLKPYFEPHKRTILAQSSNNKILIIITSPITLLEAANILKNSPRIFGVDNIIMALNLDGGLSTGMYIRSKETQFYSAEKKQVKTFLLFE